MREYPIDTLRQRGHWLARLEGEHPTYVVERSFLKGRAKGRVVEFSAADVSAPAWLVRAGEVSCDGCGRPDPKAVEVIAATSIGWDVVAVGLRSGDLLKLWEGGAPGGDPAAQVAAALEVERVEVYAADLEAPF